MNIRQEIQNITIVHDPEKSYLESPINDNVKKIRNNIVYAICIIIFFGITKHIAFPGFKNIYDLTNIPYGIIFGIVILTFFYLVLELLRTWRESINVWKNKHTKEYSVFIQECLAKSKVLNNKFSEKYKEKEGELKIKIKEELKERLEELKNIIAQSDRELRTGLKNKEALENKLKELNKSKNKLDETKEIKNLRNNIENVTRKIKVINQSIRLLSHEKINIESEYNKIEKELSDEEKIKKIAKDGAKKEHNKVFSSTLEELVKLIEYPGQSICKEPIERGLLFQINSINQNYNRLTGSHTKPDVYKSKKYQLTKKILNRDDVKKGFPIVVSLFTLSIAIIISNLSFIRQTDSKEGSEKQISSDLLSIQEFLRDPNELKYQEFYEQLGIHKNLLSSLLSNLKEITTILSDDQAKENTPKQNIENVEKQLLDLKVLLPSLQKNLSRITEIFEDPIKAKKIITENNEQTRKLLVEQKNQLSSVRLVLKNMGEKLIENELLNDKVQLIHEKVEKQLQNQRMIISSLLNNGQSKLLVYNIRSNTPLQENPLYYSGAQKNSLVLSYPVFELGSKKVNKKYNKWFNESLKLVINALSVCGDKHKDSPKPWVHVVGYPDTKCFTENDKCAKSSESENIRLANLRARTVENEIKKIDDNNNIQVSIKRWQGEECDKNKDCISEYAMMMYQAGFNDKPSGDYSQEAGQLNRRVDIHIMNAGNCDNKTIIDKMSYLN